MAQINHDDDHGQSPEMPAHVFPKCHRITRSPDAQFREGDQYLGSNTPFLACDFIAGYIHAQYPDITILRAIGRTATISHAISLHMKSLDTTAPTCSLLWFSFSGTL
jgi:hypothetical protein